MDPMQVLTPEIEGYHPHPSTSLTTFMLFHLLADTNSGMENDTAYNMCPQYGCMDALTDKQRKQPIQNIKYCTNIDYSCICRNCRKALKP